MSALLRSGLAVAALLFSAAAGAQTLACNPSSPRTDPGAGFIAFGANEQLLARGGNSGPAWEWAVGPDTEGAEKAKGSLDWVSGKVYGWTLSYAASGAGSLEIRDGAALVLSLAYPSGMDRGNALEMRVSTNASIGPGTTIGAAASAINGKSVSGGVSQTGNNLESAQSLYFYYPPMSQGLTASGTVSLTYASLPTGGRVQVTVRSGNVPCTNQAPSVSLVAPAEGTLHQAGSLISVTANAADADGTVAAVEFLANGAPIGSDTAAPFSVTWTPAAGIYSLTARASDNAGDETLSAPVSITVNAQPTVSITAPASGSVVQAPGSVTLTASAADTDGTVTKVDFYQGATLVGTATAAPYSATVSNLASGSYPFTALATDDRGGSATSAAVSVRVNAAPTVSLTSPANGAVYNAPASLTLAASAGDADGSIAKMDFYQGTTLVGTANSAPYSVTLSNQPAGTYSFTAVALDSDGQQTTSAAVSVTVNALPTVSLTSPSNNATLNAPASIALTAQVADTDGSIAAVEFYYGATLITTLTAPPYSFTWTGVPQGAYSFTARATDNAGATAVSAAVNVTVNQAVGQLYFIHADHLNTPRLIADSAGTTVWRYDQAEPFGSNPADENPSGLGSFEFPLRFPGQYFDKETGLHQNGFSLLSLKS